MFCSQCGTKLPADAVRCPDCGASLTVAAAPPLPSASTAAGRKVMTQKAKAVYTGITLVLFAGMAIAFYKSLPGGDHPVIQNQPKVAQAGSSGAPPVEMTPISSRVENGFITISLNDVLERKMVAFSYVGESKTVDLLAYINPEGKIVTSIAMCEPCNSKNFHSEGADLVCNTCGTRWNFTNLEGISGSCQKYPPDPIPSTVHGNEVRIRIDLVEKWKMRI